MLQGSRYTIRILRCINKCTVTQQCTCRKRTHSRSTRGLAVAVRAFGHRLCDELVKRVRLGVYPAPERRRSTQVCNADPWVGARDDAPGGILAAAAAGPFESRLRHVGSMQQLGVPASLLRGFRRWKPIPVRPHHPDEIGLWEVQPHRLPVDPVLPSGDDLERPRKPLSKQPVLPATGRRLLAGALAMLLSLDHPGQVANTSATSTCFEKSCDETCVSECPGVRRVGAVASSGCGRQSDVEMSRGVSRGLSRGVSRGVSHSFRVALTRRLLSVFLACACHESWVRRSSDQAPSCEPL